MVEVDPSAPVPPYEQIRSQLATGTTAGLLGVGDRLPSVRQPAGDDGELKRAHIERWSIVRIVGSTDRIIS